MKSLKSSIPGTEFPVSEMFFEKSIRPTIYNVIRHKYHVFNEDSLIAYSELGTFRQQYLQNYLLKEAGELNPLEKKVLTTINRNDFITTELVGTKPIRQTFGENCSIKWQTLVLAGNSYRFFSDSVLGTSEHYFSLK